MYVLSQTQQCICLPYWLLVSAIMAIRPILYKNFKKAGYTGCSRRNVQNFGRVFLMLKYTDITQNTYIQS